MELTGTASMTIIWSWGFITPSGGAVAEGFKATY